MSNNTGCLGSTLQVLLIIILLPLALGTCIMCGGATLLGVESGKDKSQSESILYQLGH